MRQCLCIHAAINAVLKPQFIEVDDKAEWHARCSQIAHELGEMRIRYGIDGFQFNDNRVIHDEIKPLAANFDVFVFDDDR